MKSLRDVVLRSGHDKPRPKEQTEVQHRLNEVERKITLVHPARVTP